MDILIETGKAEDLASINEIYNHYILNSNATFDTEQWDEQSRLTWFEPFSQQQSPYKLLVAKYNGQVIGFAYNSKFKEKKAYFTSSEVTVYVKPGFEGNEIGAKLYADLFAMLDNEQLHRLYAAITIPNAASIKLHEKYGFNLVGTMQEVGYKNGCFHSVSLFEKKLGG